MLKVVLAGTYPAHTYEKLRKLLPAQACMAWKRSRCRGDMSCSRRRASW